MEYAKALGDPRRVDRLDDLLAYHALGRRARRRKTSRAWRGVHSRGSERRQLSAEKLREIRRRGPVPQPLRPSQRWIARGRARPQGVVVKRELSRDGRRGAPSPTQLGIGVRRRALLARRDGVICDRREVVLGRGRDRARAARARVRLRARRAAAAPRRAARGGRAAARDIAQRTAQMPRGRRRESAPKIPTRQAGVQWSPRIILAPRDSPYASGTRARSAPPGRRLAQRRCAARLHGPRTAALARSRARPGRSTSASRTQQRRA